MEDEIERLRDKVAKAQKKLYEAVAKACPGPHNPQQHRDGKPPWCRACERTAMGQRKDELELGASWAGK